MPVQGAKQTVLDDLSRWEGLNVQPHRFGGTEWVMGRREIGHIHGDALVDIPFPKRVRDELVAAGEAEKHHVLPESGWVSVWLREPDDVPRAVRLLRRSYDLAVAQKERMEGLQ
jgi:hypothetical protein